MKGRKNNPKRILFLCTHNSARSQMAEGLLRRLGGDSFAAFSAGLAATAVRSEAVAVMKEIGIDISTQISKTWVPYLKMPFDAVITVCAGANEACPLFPNTRKRLHWSIDDPSMVQGPEAERLQAFRRARDEIRERIEKEILNSEWGFT